MNFFVYLFVNVFGVVIYVGKTCNGDGILTRMMQHKCSNKDNYNNAYNEMIYIRYTEVPDEYTMNNLEGLLQNLYRPKYNLKIEHYDTKFAPGTINWIDVKKENLNSKNVVNKNILKIYKNKNNFIPDGEDTLYAIEYKNGNFYEQDLGNQPYIYGFSVQTSVRNRKDGMSRFMEGVRVKYYPNIKCDTDDLYLKSYIKLNDNFGYRFKMISSTREQCIQDIIDMCNVYKQNEEYKLDRYRQTIKPRINAYNSILEEIDNYYNKGDI